MACLFYVSNIFEFKNGGTYAGAVKKGKPHGWGLYMDNTSDNKVSYGKFNYGTLNIKVDSKTMIQLSKNISSNFNLL